MTIGVLGPLTAGTDAALSPRDRVVLSALVLRHGSVASAEELADALWGDQPPPSWHKVVPGCVNRLRRALGPEAIITAAHGYRLALGEDAVDIRSFERHVTKGHQLLALGEPDRAIHAFREALGLWRGPPLRDLEDWPPAHAEIERLEELRLETEDAVIDASLRVGLQAGILAEARSRVAQAPMRERRWALLALAQYLSGSQVDALSTLRRAREMLSRELGLDPGPELSELETRVLRHDPGLSANTALKLPVARCPYPGLLPYDVNEADFFFGRSADLATCRDHLERRGVLVLVGPSGSGKSSLLRAGLAASLVAEGRSWTSVPPGASEDEVLREIELGDPRTTLLLDQLEEVVARLPSPAQRMRLGEALAACVGRRPLALAIRADRFGDLAELPGIATLAESGLVFLAPLGEDALREAIEGPARVAALLLEPGMVDLLLQDVRDDPGALPLLSHALRETWERREGRTLTVEGYRTSGGIRGAVARSAEEVYEGLPEDDRAKLRGLMLRLLNLAPDGEPLRSAVPRGAIPGDAAHDHLVERLVRARLITADADVLDLAHETLARAWPRLRGWLDDDREGQRILRHLSTAAESWRAMGRPDVELYQGDRLTRALAWRASSEPELTSHEEEFLRCSSVAAAAAAAERERDASAQRSRRRRVRALVAVATSLTVVAAVTGATALRERDRAATERARASAERQVASARRAASLSHISGDIVPSLLLAVEAVRRDDSIDTRGALLAALTRSPALIRVLPYDATLVPSADGRRLFALQGGDLGPQTLDTATFRPLPEVDALDGVLAEPGLTVVAWEDDPVLERSGGFQLAPPPGGTRPGLERAAVDRRGDRIAALYTRESSAGDRKVSTVLLWDPREGPGRSSDALELTVQGTPDRGGVDDLELSADGGRLFLAGRGAGSWLRAHDATSGELVASLSLPEGRPAQGGRDTPLESSVLTPGVIEQSHDGRWLATNAGADVLLINTKTLEVQERLRGHTQRVLDIGFSRNARLVAASSVDGSILVWHRATGALLNRFEGGPPADDLVFSPDSTTLYASSRGTVGVWDLSGRREFLRKVNDPVGQLGYLVVPSPDGRSAAYFRATVTSRGKDAGVDIVTSRGRHLSVPAAFANWGAYSPSGDQLVTIADSRLQVWDPLRGRLLAQARVPGIVDGLAATYTADGSLIVAGDRNGTLRTLDAATLGVLGAPLELEQPLGDLVAAGKGTRVVALMSGSSEDGVPAYVQVDPGTGEIDPGGVQGADPLGFGAVSPDGRRLTVTHTEGRVELIDLDTEKVISGPTQGHDSIATRIDFNGDGSRFVTGGLDGRVVLWDGHTGERLAEVRPLDASFSTGVAFLPDGHTVSIATSNGQLFRWDTDVAAWIADACRVAGRNLSADEWRGAFGSEPYRETCPVVAG